jgi:hypothetical protein
MKLNVNRPIKKGMWVRLEASRVQISDEALKAQKPANMQKLILAGLKDGRLPKCEQTGIIQNLDFQAGTCDVHLCDDQGNNLCVLPSVDMRLLRQARYAEIPKPRRQLPREHFQRLGYL